ncbi:MAG TPA: sugar ABC transporter permease [Candidatus Dorea intestinavium]|nr:sugar ABC transporter permease [Candidatus Dorea intestinavium]
MNRSKKINSIQILLMLLPLLILFVLFCLYPLIDAIRLSFTKYNGFTAPEFIGIENYIRLVKDTSWWKAVLNTFQLTAMAYVIQIPLSLLFAIILNSKLKGTNFFRTMIFLPNITSTAIIGIVFFFMFSSHNGIINGVLLNIGFISKPIEWLGNVTCAKLVIIILNTWGQVGYLMILFLAAIQKIPAELYESAKLDGASKWKQFKNVTLPMLGPMFQVISMMCILNGFQLFDSVKVLTNGGPGNETSVMALYIYNYFFNSTGAQQGYASSVSVCATFITAAVGALYFWITSKKFKEN